MERRLTFATAWLGGCTGCHMSFLDMDERLLELPSLVSLVYSPLMDIKRFPESVDITFVEGAVATSEDRDMLHRIRDASGTLVALGDCAVSGNVTALRNIHGSAAALSKRYGDHVPGQASMDELPALLHTVLPLHRVVPVDVFLPGCPPHADLIWRVLTDIAGGRPVTLNEPELRPG